MAEIQFVFSVGEISGQNFNLGRIFQIFQGIVRQVLAQPWLAYYGVITLAVFDMKPFL